MVSSGAVLAIVLAALVVPVHVTAQALGLTLRLEMHPQLRSAVHDYRSKGRDF